LTTAEYISETTKTLAAQHGIEIAFIHSVQPQQNAYVERCNRTVRYDVSVAPAPSVHSE